jgi:hypothetical protein
MHLNAAMLNNHQAVAKFLSLLATLLWKQEPSQFEQALRKARARLVTSGAVVRISKVPLVLQVFKLIKVIFVVSGYAAITVSDK